MVNLIREIRGTSVGSESLSPEDKSGLARMIADELPQIGEKMERILYLNRCPITTLDAHFIVFPDRALVKLCYLSAGEYCESIFPLDIFYSL